MANFWCLENEMATITSVFLYLLVYPKLTIFACRQRQSAPVLNLSGDTQYLKELVPRH